MNKVEYFTDLAKSIEKDERRMNDDTISRQAAIKWVKTECNPYGKPTLDYETGCKVMKHLELMPSAERQGRWIENEFGTYCSECGLYAYRSNGIPWKSNYCPICGSFNGEGGENEELQR